MNSIIRNDLYKIFKSKAVFVLFFIFWIVAIASLLTVNFKMTSLHINFIDSFKILTMISNYSVLIWALMFFGKYMSDEHKDGTIKLSLINSILRREIILGKFITFAMSSFAILIINTVIAFIISSILFFESITSSAIGVGINSILEIIPLVAVGALVLFISIIVEKGSQVIYIMMFIYFLASNFLANMANNNIIADANNGFLENINFSIIIMSILFVAVFLVAGITVFNKKEFR